MRQILEVGQGFGKKSFEKALTMANNNDVVMLNPGHYSVPKNVTLCKNIQIVSKTKKCSDVIVNTGFNVVDNAKVNIKNITIENENERTSITCSDGSELTIEGCRIIDIKDFSEKNEYFRIYSKDSLLRIIDSEIIENGNPKSVCFDHSRGYIEGTILQCVTARDNSIVKMYNNEVNKQIFIDDNSKIESEGILSVSSIPNYDSLNLSNNSQLFVEKLQSFKSPIIYGTLIDSYLKIDDIIFKSGYKMIVEQNMQSTVDANFEEVEVVTKEDEQKYAYDYDVNENNNSSFSEEEYDEKYEEEYDEEYCEEYDYDEESLENDYNNPEQKSVNDLMEELNNLQGLKNVKEKVKEFISVAKFNKERKEQGLPFNNVTFHSVFLGNPGTGKTTVARLLSQILYNSGVIESDVFVEVSREDLVSAHIGDTAIKTKAVLKKANKGILFIDEAYTLYKDSGSDFGNEAVDTILKYMEDNKDSIMIIFAGYTKEMQKFISMNPGLKSRIPNEFYFEDYTEDEIADIGISSIVKQGYFVDEAYYKKALISKYKSETDKSNARFVRNFNEQLIFKVAMRVANESEKDYQTIKREDIDSLIGGNKLEKNNKIAELLEELNNLIGLEDVKSYVNDLIKQVQANHELESYIDDNNNFSYHMIFSGNPGTGKTTVARIIAGIFYNLDILSKNSVIEVSRTDLVGRYIGHTESKTNDIINLAMGGVLFIDEAYQLTNVASNNDFGSLAVETLITALENNRDQFIAIFAGYKSEMELFLDTNPGLRSRIPITIEFPDYTPYEVGKIVRLYLKKWDIGEYPLEEQIESVYSNLDEKDKSNARWARNISEEIIKNHKIWLVDNDCDNPLKIDYDIINSTILNKII